MFQNIISGLFFFVVSQKEEAETELSAGMIMCLKETGICHPTFPFDSTLLVVAREPQLLNKVTELFLAVREYELPTWDRHMTGLLDTWSYLLYTK